MITAAKAHQISISSFKERRYPQIEEELGKEIEDAARAGYTQLSKSIYPLNQEHLDLIIQILRENKYKVVVEKASHTLYFINIYW